MPSSSNAQIPFLNVSSPDSESQSPPWWQFNKARVCGKFLCSDITFPYFPYRSFATKLNLQEDFTIASRVNLENPENSTKQLNIRSSLVEQTLFAVYDKVKGRTQKMSQEEWREKANQLNLALEDWLMFREKPLHPLTPNVEIGQKNDLTVLFVPTQSDLGLSAETVITVTEDDSIYNGKTIEELAKQWRLIIRQEWSQALWGKQFDRIFFGARLIIIAIVLIVMIVPIILLTIFSRLFRTLEFKLKVRVKYLQELFIKQQEDELYNKSESQETEAITNNKNPQESSELNFSLGRYIVELKKLFKPSLFKPTQIRLFLSYAEKIILSKIQDLTQKNATVSLANQNVTKQIKNIITYIIKLVNWLRLFILFIGLSVICCIYPQTRLISFFFIIQALFLPLIWMLVSLADTTLAFIIDYYLNKWAKQGTMNDPSSNRYTLRVATYSPALKGASSFIFIIVGIVLTIKLLGIDPSLLASAGGAAILVGFLGRNVLEDMLNGVLILWTDRYAIGDIITIGSYGGFVENMNLYNTQIRGAEGRLITIPNGQINIVENKTKDWSRVDFKIEISANSDINQAFDILKKVGDELGKDPDWQESILEPTSILGIDQVTHQGVIFNVRIKTQPMKHFAVGREYRRRVFETFKAEGIELGVPQRQILHIGDIDED